MRKRRGELRVAKKLLSLLLIFVLVASATACGKETENTSSSAADNNGGSTEDSAVAEDSGTSDAEDSDDAVAQDGELTTVRMSILSTGSQLWIKVINDHTKIFEKYGIDLQTSEYSMGINTADALVTGEIDIGILADYAAANRFGNTAANTDFRIIAQSSNSTTSNIYAPAEIENPKDLEGKHVTTISATIYDYWYAKFFETYGIDASTVTLDGVTAAAEGLALAKAGTSYAQWAVGDTAKKLQDDYGWHQINDDSFNIKTYSIWIANNTWATANHDTLVKFLEASDEALQYLSDNQDEVAGWVSEETGEDEALVKASIAASVDKLQFEQGCYDALQAVNAYCLENGNYTTEYDFKDFINIDALKEAFPDRVTYQE